MKLANLAEEERKEKKKKTICSTHTHTLSLSLCVSRQVCDSTLRKVCLFCTNQDAGWAQLWSCGNERQVKTLPPLDRSFQFSYPGRVDTVQITKSDRCYEL